DWIFNDQVKEEILEIDGKTYRRDPDVFDTWLSSSSWPYATLDYPDGDDFKHFYPLSLMETGGEILYPWVSRMIMLGLYVTGKVPFKEVYIHGYVMAEDGSKMSKSIGNVVDPFPVIQKYGSDALRMGIIAGRSPAVNRGYDQRKVEDARNFCNKLWNVARFIEAKLGDDFTDRGEPTPQSVADTWMLSKLQQSIDAMALYMDSYRFSEASEQIYHLVWDDFADWYVEASKTHLNKNVLAYALEVVLKLTHPFAPFVTETIWQTLSWQTGAKANPEDQTNMLITSEWPKPIKVDQKSARVFEEIKTIVSEIRYIRANLNGGRPKLYHRSNEFINLHKDLIKSLSGVHDVISVRDGSGLNLTQTNHVCWLDLDQETIERFKGQLSQKLDETKRSIAQLEGRLANKVYVNKAPKALVDETKNQLSVAQSLLKKQQTEHDRFS
ncbi:MAG: class I tRNA ligase family protein, partial [Candidatus Saccharimonadales bacterium]